MTSITGPNSIGPLFTKIIKWSIEVSLLLFVVWLLVMMAFALTLLWLLVYIVLIKEFVILAVVALLLRMNFIVCHKVIWLWNILALIDLWFVMVAFAERTIIIPLAFSVIFIILVQPILIVIIQTTIILCFIFHLGYSQIVFVCVVYWKVTFFVTKRGLYLMSMQFLWFGWLHNV